MNMKIAMAAMVPVTITLLVGCATMETTERPIKGQLIRILTGVGEFSRDVMGGIGADFTKMNVGETVIITAQGRDHYNNYIPDTKRTWYRRDYSSRRVHSSR